MLIPEGSDLVGSTDSLAFARVSANTANQLVPETGNLHKVTWTAPGSVTGIESLRIALVSTRLPGFSQAFLQNGAVKPLTQQIADTFPSDVLQQVQPLLQEEWNSARTLALAPLFPASTSRHWIASNFSAGISMLVHTKDLDSGSPLVISLKAMLQVYLTDQTGVLVPSLPSIPA
ncbi:MAG: hypothetical protein M3N93_04010 [Acidobacteriota bacterium]|nr:hypothetical protein [Acidobacteriota bacterium]